MVDTPQRIIDSLRLVARKLRRVAQRIWARRPGVRQDMGDMIHRLRVEREATSDTVLAFWRGHGRDWADEEASYDDLKFFGELSERVADMTPANRAAEVEATLRSVWRSGFINPAEAFGWNDMNEGLPAAAFVAFVEGVGEKWVEAKSKL